MMKILLNSGNYSAL